MEPAALLLILHLAIGGDWPGNPTNGIPANAELTVDWVRVYDAN